MFEENTTDKAMKIAGLAVIAIAAAWVISYAIRDGRNTADEHAMAEVVAAMDESLPPLRHVAAAANDGMAAHVATVQAKADDARMRAAEIREAAKPKAYRWKDSNGQWHISDRAPADVESEVIPLR